MAETIGARMARVPHPHGFDYLRILLAWGVLFFHSFALTGVRGAPFAQLGELTVPSFFALAGFLIAGSLERSRTVAGFFTLRAVRLGPALAFEIVLSALILGPLVTTAALGDYFAAPEFRSYFLNLIGWPHYYLPGVFTDHPMQQVNGQLWTLPWDLVCYGGVALLAVIGLIRRPKLVLALLLAVVAMRTAMAFVPATRGMWSAGAKLAVAFSAGLTLYLLRDRVPRSLPLMLGCVVLVWLTSSRMPTANLAMLPLAYATIWLGQLDPPATWIAGKADYSYGVYLFAFPLQQWVQTVPMLRVWYLNASVATVLAFGCAAISWHLVERPVLRRKRRAVAAVEQALGGFAVRLPDPPAHAADEGLARER
jgi:peptidoglycan/LPS O-acetylase OafA/YrhL